MASMLSKVAGDQRSKLGPAAFRTRAVAGETGK